MEEKEEEHAGSDSGAVVKEEEKHTPRGSEGSQESKAREVPSDGGGRRETLGSMVSPSLNPIVIPDVTNDDSKAESSNIPEISAKARRRNKERERKKAKYAIYSV